MKKLSIIVLSAVFFLAFGCAKKQTVQQPKEIVPETPAVQAPAAPEEPSEEPSIRYADWAAVPQIATIYFDYDQADLLESARAALKRNAEYLKNNPDVEVLVEGNCDERGTFEYNLALGQRRAAAVREYYGQLGVAIGRIGTISYGEEQPAVVGTDEASFAKNRRVETKIRTKK